MHGVADAVLCLRLHRAVHHHINLKLALNGADLGGILHWFHAAALVPFRASHQALSRLAHHHLRLLGAHRMVVDSHGALLHSVRQLGLRDGEGALCLKVLWLLRVLIILFHRVASCYWLLGSLELLDAREDIVSGEMTALVSECPVNSRARFDLHIEVSFLDAARSLGK